jgi:hypothetical protein
LKSSIDEVRGQSGEGIKKRLVVAVKAWRLAAGRNRGRYRSERAAAKIKSQSAALAISNKTRTGAEGNAIPGL